MIKSIFDILLSICRLEFKSQTKFKPFYFFHIHCINFENVSILHKGNNVMIVRTSKSLIINWNLNDINRNASKKIGTHYAGIMKN